MATHTFQAYPSNSSDALFKAWGKGLSDAMAAVGLVNVTSTITSNTAIGGIGTLSDGWTDADLLAPGGINTLVGFEVWRFDDGALQTSNPVYFKIWYGSGTATNTPRIDIQVGQGVDGSENLTGTVATLMSPASGSSTAVSLYSSFISSDGGRINVVMFAHTLSHPFAFYIERTKDDSGNPTADGVNIVTIAIQSNGNNQQYLPASGAVYPAAPMTQPMCAAPPTGAGSYGANIGLYPIYPNVGYAGNPDLGGLVYFSSDIASPGTGIAVTLYGVSHTYVTMGTANTSATVNGNTTDFALAVRYE